jgi:hypothetical protein
VKSPRHPFDRDPISISKVGLFHFDGAPYAFGAGAGAASEVVGAAGSVI